MESDSLDQDFGSDLSKSRGDTTQRAPTSMFSMQAHSPRGGSIIVDAELCAFYSNMNNKPALLLCTWPAAVDSCYADHGLLSLLLFLLLLLRCAAAAATNASPAAAAAAAAAYPLQQRHRIEALPVALPGSRPPCSLEQDDLLLRN